MIPSIRAPRCSSIWSAYDGVGGVGGAVAVGVLVVRLGEQPDQPVTGGEVERQHLVAERVLRGRERAVVVRAGVVELGDDDGSRHADLAALHPQRLGRFIDALVRRDDEQCAVRRSQPRPQLADEVGVAGRVDQVDLDAVVQQRGQGESDRALLADLRVVVVADRRAVHDGAGPGAARRRRPEGRRRGWSCRRPMGRPAPRCGWRPDCPRWERLQRLGKYSSCLP